MPILFKFCNFESSSKFLLTSKQKAKAAEFPLTPKGTHLSDSGKSVKQFITEEVALEGKEALLPGVSKRIHWLIFLKETTHNSPTFLDVSKKLAQDPAITLTNITEGKLPGISIVNI